MTIPISIKKYVIVKYKMQGLGCMYYIGSYRGVLVYKLYIEKLERLVDRLYVNLDA